MPWLEPKTARVLVRPIAAICLLIVLIATPFLSLAAQSSDSPSCGMKCCARMKKCCCKGERHSDTDANASRGPAIKALNQCPRECRQAPAVRTIATNSALSVLRHAPIVAASRSFYVASDATWLDSPTAFSTHQRPPPSRV